MLRDSDVMLCRRLGGEAYVTSGLPRELVTDSSQAAGKVGTRNVARQSQTAITCSRVK